MQDPDLLQQFLRHSDTPCPLCGYNLRDLTSNVCPECGQRVALSVTSPDLRFGNLVATAAPMLVIVGMGLLTLLVTVFEGPPPGSGWGLVGLFALSVVDVVLAVGLYRRRVRFLRQPAATQRRIAVVSCVAHLILMVAFLVDLF